MGLKVNTRLMFVFSFQCVFSVKFLFHLEETKSVKCVEMACQCTIDYTSISQSFQHRGTLEIMFQSQGTPAKITVSTTNTLVR